MCPALSDHQVVKAEKHHDDQHRRCKTCVKNELKKELHVFSTHAIVDPGTVMVHFENAHAALAAVMCALGFPMHVTLSAVLDALH